MSSDSFTRMIFANSCESCPTAHDENPIALLEESALLVESPLAHAFCIRAFPSASKDIVLRVV